MVKWLELFFETTHEAAEVITDYLSALGAEGVQVYDATEIKAILSEPQSLIFADQDFLDQLDQEPVVQIKAYFAQFEQGICRNQTISLLTVKLYDNRPKTYVSLTELEQTITGKMLEIAKFLPLGQGYKGAREVKEEDWSENWKKYYETTHLTKGIVINPSWLKYEPKPGEIIISLDPGSAFGTGTHESTQLCAALLADLVTPNCHMLDLGTGSGILAIMAAKLGCAYVEAIDIDLLAVQVAKSNIDLNQVEAICHEGELADAREQTYDLIVANIIAEVISDLSSAFKEKMHTGSQLIVSGIISDKAETVKADLKEAGFKLISEISENIWHAMLWQC